MNDNADFTPAPIPTERELASFDHRTVSSPVEVIGDVRIAAEPSLSGLPPEMRERINAKLADASPAAREALVPQLIRSELEANSYRLKVLAALEGMPTSTSASASASCAKSTTWRAKLLASKPS